MSYDPTIGRWISQDPIGFKAGDANIYRYVGNSPTLSMDPSGLWVFPWDHNANWGDWRIGEATTEIIGLSPSDLWNAANTASNNWTNKYPSVSNPVEGSLIILQSLVGSSLLTDSDIQDSKPSAEFS
jgi:uncharacterized protein RhaS with RHS repeats